MQGQELATQFRNIVDDDFDTTHLYQLFSQAKNEIERMEKLEVCKKLDSTKTAAVGDTYTTLKSLPTDFRVPIKLMLDSIEYKPVTFDQQIAFRNVALRYCINHATQKFFSLAPVSRAGTWNLFYIYKTDDFTVANENSVICVWPSEFHPLIAYKAAKIFQANIDGDAVSFRMSDEQETEYQRLLSGLRNWNHDLILASMDGRTGFDPSENDEPIDIGLM